MSTEEFVFSGNISNNSFIELTSRYPHLALPDPVNLHLHAACCNVARMSGAAGYYDLLFDGDGDGYPERQAVPHVLEARLYEILTERNSLVNPS